jgi:hypothetical protein
MAIFRTGIALACAVALLPADKAQQERLFLQAIEVSEWVRGYCEREADKCQQASDLWDGFREKAVFAGRLSLDAYQKYAASSTFDGLPKSTTATSEMVTASQVAYMAREPSRPLVDTLLREDMLPAWRGPKAR